MEVLGDILPPPSTHPDVFVAFVLSHTLTLSPYLHSGQRNGILIFYPNEYLSIRFAGCGSLMRMRGQGMGLVNPDLSLTREMEARAPLHACPGPLITRLLPRVRVLSV